MTVNSTTWKSLPIAARESKFDHDDALVRIKAWAGGDLKRYSSAFLWSNPDGPSNNVNSYRLPVGDISNGKLILIPRAIFSAATILSGAHGGLEGVVGEDEKLALKRVVTSIYEVLQKQYGDPRTVPPWLRGGNDKEQALSAADTTEEDEVKLEELDALITASVRTGGWQALEVADPDHQWQAKKAMQRLWDAADGNIRAYGQGFLWHDPAAPEQRNSYRLPIADVIDGRTMIVPDAIHRLSQIIAANPGTVAVPEPDLDVIATVVAALRDRLDDPEAILASIYPVAPPDEWFAVQELPGPTPLTITADGRVSGHGWLWGTCHQGIGDRCVTPPRSKADYRYFANGSVLTASGKLVKVGKITKGTGHASPRLGWVPAADHYDNTGTVVAAVSVHEDKFGGQFAGAIVPNANDMDVAELRRSPISGDWRRINNNLELVAALAVNVPGFPIVSLNAAGVEDCILAAGVQAVDDTDPGCGCDVAKESVTADVGTDERVARYNKIVADVAELSSTRRARRLRNILNLQGGK
jgi:hypothetical protein